MKSSAFLWIVGAVALLAGAGRAAETAKTSSKPEPVPAFECEALAKRMTEKFNAGRTVGIFEEMDQRIFVDQALRGFEIAEGQNGASRKNFVAA